MRDPYLRGRRTALLLRRPYRRDPADVQRGSGVQTSVGRRILHEPGNLFLRGWFARDGDSGCRTPNDPRARSRVKFIRRPPIAGAGRRCAAA